MRTNPLIAAMEARGIEAPAAPMDMSEIFDTKGIKNVYIIAMTGRCGSTWLASELSALPNSGKPQEYFSEEMLPYIQPDRRFGSFAEFLESVVDTGRTGDTFGFKIDSTRLSRLAEVIDLRLSFATPLTKWVDMRRINIVKQAFSFAKAKRTGVWHAYSEEEAKNTGSPLGQAGYIPDEVIWREIDLLMKSESRLADIYLDLSVSPLAIRYEEMLDSKPQLILQVLSHLFPDRDLPEILEEPKKSTRKLAASGPADNELAFVRRHSAAINRVNADRISNL